MLTKEKLKKVVTDKARWKSIFMVVFFSLFVNSTEIVEEITDIFEK